MILWTWLFGGEINIAVTPNDKATWNRSIFLKLWKMTTEELKFFLGFVSLKL